MPTDPTPNVGVDLLRIHRAITRAVEVSLEYSQPDRLPEAQRAGFTAYVRALTLLLHSHHAGEDEIAFPFWQTRLPRGPFKTLTRHHREILTYLGQIEGWLEVGAGLDGLHKTISSLNTLWCTHISLEEATLGPENAGKYLTPDENAQLTRQLAEHGQAHSQPAELVIPFIIYNLSAQDRAQYARLLPPVIMQELVPFAWKPIWAPMQPFLLAE